MKERSEIQENKLAIITGASSGIGFELAKVFGKNGYDLMIVAENTEIFDAQEQLENLGYDAQAFQINLADFQGVELFFDKIEAQSRCVDAIALNAGVGVGGSFAQETDLMAEMNLIDLNVTSTVHLAKKIVQKMLKDGEGGRLLFTSSLAALSPGPFEAVYAASKAFIQSFALALRSELTETGIRVTTFMPGPTDTNFFQRARLTETKLGHLDKDDPAIVAEQAFEAMISDQDQVIVGSLKNKIQGLASKVLPDKISTMIQKNLLETTDLQ